MSANDQLMRGASNCVTKKLPPIIVSTFYINLLIKIQIIVIDSRTHKSIYARHTYVNFQYEHHQVNAFVVLRDNFYYITQLNRMVNNRQMLEFVDLQKKINLIFTQELLSSSLLL